MTKIQSSKFKQEGEGYINMPKISVTKILFVILTLPFRWDHSSPFKTYRSLHQGESCEEVKENIENFNHKMAETVVM